MPSPSPAKTISAVSVLMSQTVKIAFSLGILGSKSPESAALRIYRELGDRASEDELNTKDSTDLRSLGRVHPSALTEILFCKVESYRVSRRPNSLNQATSACS